jgi:hypothetical protein
LIPWSSNYNNNNNGIIFLFQAISDNATRREQEAVAAQRRAIREADEELKRKMANGMGTGRIKGSSLTG